MRIRNRPVASVFPPPPDLNLNRRSLFLPSSSSPPPSSSPQVLQDAAATNFSLAVSTAKRSPARAAAGNSKDDNDDEADSNTSSWKDGIVEDDDNGVQRPSSHPKGIVRKGAAVKRGSRVGAAVTEGSRCSRVNGRGWRCGQQTLVGYSLCEHHLGKSRLRSLSSVKNNVVMSKTKDDFAVVALSSNKKTRLVEESDDRDGDEPLLISSGKKLRIGTVKVRSLSSLLGQTSEANRVSQSSAHKRNASN